MLRGLLALRLEPWPTRSRGPVSQQPGGLEVTLNVDGAQWAVDGGAWQDSGAIVSGLTVGSHTVSFISLDGWTAPAAETISILNDQTNAITATYVSVSDMGSVMVVLNIVSGEWAVDAGEWQSTGAIVSGLSPGSHTVTFGPVVGWTAPASEIITVSADETNSIAAMYADLPQTGGLQVTLSAAGAQWSVDSGAM